MKYGFAIRLLIVVLALTPTFFLGGVGLLLFPVVSIPGFLAIERFEKRKYNTKFWKPTKDEILNMLDM
ncbi:MAG TPA: hypothetical protein VFO76_10680 [Candidatus Kapabacteria bacterium]|nr:hypothetical protein [Candidatus Kapabacteria bacterium]